MDAEGSWARVRKDPFWFRYIGGMTREEFIKVLEEKGYPYREKGNKIFVTSNRSVDLSNLTSISPGMEFRRNVDLSDLTSLPPGVGFRNKGSVYLRSLTSLPPGVEFKNVGQVDLSNLTSISPDVVFENVGHVYLSNLASLPPGVEFRNKESVHLKFFIGGWLGGWPGNIKGIDSKRLLNKMISIGLLDKR